MKAILEKLEGYPGRRHGRRMAPHLLVCVALILGGCAGVESDLPSQKIDNDISINLIPVTADLLQKELPAPAATVEEDPSGAFKSKFSDYRYRIGVGDVLNLSVPTLTSAGAPSIAQVSIGKNSADLSSSSSPTSAPDPSSIIGQQGTDFEVFDDGTMFLPYAGPLKIQGMTVREATSAIVDSLSKYIRSPQIVISIKGYRSQRVLVTGQVDKPGYLPVTDVPLTLVAALSQAGALVDVRGRKDARTVGTVSALSGQPPLEAPDLTHVVLTRDGNRHMINIQNLLSGGKDFPDPILLDGDIIYVPPTARGDVVIMGEVLRPQLSEIALGHTSLADVIMVSGGLNQITSKPSRIYVIRGALSAPDVYQINAQRPDGFLLAQAFPLQSKDIIFVSEAPVNRWNRFLQAILPSVQGLLNTAVIVNSVNNLN